MEIGVQTWGTDAVALRRYWALADELGYARITYGDGLGAWTFDGWTALGALAILTRRARLGPAVTYAFDRAAHHPSWLAKRAVTLDHLSGGRAELRLGVGAEDQDTARGWTEHGITYPPASLRVAMVEEAIAIVRDLWAGKRVVRHGPHWPLAGAMIAPLPLQEPGLPVWVAAMGRHALAAAARSADGWEASYVTPSAFAERWALVRRGLAVAGRPEAGFRRSVELDVVLAGPARLDAALDGFCRVRDIARDHPLLATMLCGDAAAVAARLADYEAAGVTDVMLGFADFPGTGMLEALARDVVPLLRAREPRSSPRAR